MFDECFKCGISGERVKLSDAISKDGIVKICNNCSSEEDIPIIRKPTSFQLRESEKRPTMYERLSNAAGIKKDISKEKIPQRINLETKQETTLKDIINKNLKIKAKEDTKSREDLVDNFHWIIMRTRRLKHISQRQLAEAINEPELAIKMAEQGVLHENSYKLLNKLENYFGIKLMKQNFVREIKERQPDKVIDFDPVTTKTLTISDLKEMKRKKENEIFDIGGKVENIEKIEDFEEIPEYEDYIDEEDSFS